MSQGFANNSGTVSDGDKGDITVTGSGTTWTIDNNVVTYAKMQDVSATDKVLGRSTAGAGDVEEITCTSAGRALLDDASASDQRTTLGLGSLATQSGTFSGTSSGTNTGDQNIFQTIAVAGQSDVVADSTSDTLTLAAGSNVTITTNAGTDTITIASSGGSISDGDKGDITVSSSGAVWTIDSGVITSGTYTPTLTNEQLITSSTAYQCQYMRVRSVVTVSGQVEITPSGISGLAVRLGISLPISSNLANEQDLGGTAAQVGSPAAARIHANATNDRARLTFNSTSTSSGTWSFSFTYRII